MTLKDPAWVSTAKSYLGQKEVKGPHHNPHILRWWKDIGAPYVDDETPWCGAFIGGVMSEVGIKPVKLAAAAASWSKFGTKLDRPAYGCLAIKKRKGGNHVTMIIGKTASGKLLGLGGNQGDTVSIAEYDPKVFTSFRWPGIMPFPERYNLPVLTVKTAGKSVKES